MHTFSIRTNIGPGPVCPSHLLLRFALLTFFLWGSHLPAQHHTCVRDSLTFEQAGLKIDIAPISGTNDKWRIKGSLSNAAPSVQKIAIHLNLSNPTGQEANLTFNPNAHAFSSDGSAFWGYAFDPVANTMTIEGIRPTCEGKNDQGLLFSFDLNNTGIPISSAPPFVSGGLVIADVAIGIKRQLSPPRISPNPATTYLDLPNSFSPSSQYHIINQQGQKVMSGHGADLQNKRIYIHQLKPGMYRIMLSSDTALPVFLPFIKL